MSCALNCEDANTHLLDVLEDYCKARDTSLNARQWLSLARAEASRFPEALLVVAAAALYVAAAVLHARSAPPIGAAPNSDGNMYAATAALLLIMLCAQIALSAWRARLESTERMSILRQRVIFFIKNRFHYESVASARLRVPPFESLVLVLRDRMWMRLPLAVLVENDIIQLSAGEVPPCRVRPVVRRVGDAALFDDVGDSVQGSEGGAALVSTSASSIELAPVAASTASAAAGLYRVAEEPSVRLIDGVFGDAVRRPPTMFAHYTRILRRTNAVLLAGGVALGLVLRFLSLYLPAFVAGSACTSSAPSAWLYSHDFIAYVGTLLLPLSFVSLPTLLFALDAAAHAFLFAAHEETQRQISALRPKLKSAEEKPNWDDEEVVPPQLIRRSVRKALQSHFATTQNDDDNSSSSGDRSDDSDSSDDYRHHRSAYRRDEANSGGAQRRDGDDDDEGDAHDAELSAFADSPSMMLTAAIQPSGAILNSRMSASVVFVQFCLTHFNTLHSYFFASLSSHSLSYLSRVFQWQPTKCGSNSSPLRAASRPTSRSRRNRFTRSARSITFALSTSRAC